MVQDERCTRINRVHHLCFYRTANLILGAADCQARLSMQDLGSESGAGGGTCIAARAASYSRVLLHCLYWSTLLLLTLPLDLTVPGTESVQDSRPADKRE